ncbi:MAG: ABC transporter permease [Clostridia bacterium]
MRGFFKGTYLGLMLVFMYAPIIVLIVFSFTNSRTMSNWNGFSLAAYQKLFSDSALLNALSTTLTVGIISAIIATVLGTFAAIGIYAMKKRNRVLIENCTQLPMVNPDLVTGISLMLLFTFMMFSNGYMRMLIAHITFNIPYVIFSVLPKLRQSSNSLYEAAMDLGCTPMQALLKVVIPDITPGIISGFILAFTLSIDDFVISWFAADGVQNLSIYVYSIARKGVDTKINALSALMFVVVATLLLIVNLRTIKQEREEAAQRKKLTARV